MTKRLFWNNPLHGPRKETSNIEIDVTFVKSCVFSSRGTYIKLFELYSRSNTLNEDQTFFVSVNGVAITTTREEDKRKVNYNIKEFAARKILSYNQEKNMYCPYTYILIQLFF